MPDIVAVLSYKCPTPGCGRKGSCYLDRRQARHDVNDFVFFCKKGDRHEKKSQAFCPFCSRSAEDHKVEPGEQLQLALVFS